MKTAEEILVGIYYIIDENGNKVYYEKDVIHAIELCNNKNLYKSEDKPYNTHLGVKTAEGLLAANCFEFYQNEDDLCLKFTMEDAVKTIREYGLLCAEQALKDAAEKVGDFDSDTILETPIKLP